MVVVGKHMTILADTGNKVDTSPFIPYYQDMEKLSIVNAEVQYTCQYTENLCILMFMNDLSVPSMENNLTPPLILR